MDGVRLDVAAVHLGLGDLNALAIGLGVDLTFDREPARRGGDRDQVDHRQPTGQRAALPVLGDMAKEPVLDPVLLQGARRVVAHADRQAGLIGELLQFDLPQLDTRAVRAAAIGADHQPNGVPVRMVGATFSGFVLARISHHTVGNSAQDHRQW